MGGQQNKSTYQDTVKVLVGGKPYKHFHVHRDILLGSSDYFIPILKHHTRPVFLKDEVPRAFETIVDCLYGRTIPSIMFDNLGKTIDAYTLADKLAMRTIQNEIMNEIQRFFTQDSLHASWLTTNVLGTTLTSPLCRFFTDLYAFQLVASPCSALAIGDTEFSEEFQFLMYEAENPVRDMVMQKYFKVQLEWKRSQYSHNVLHQDIDPSYQTTCTYHVHDNGTVCSRGRGGQLVRYRGGR